MRLSFRKFIAQKGNKIQICCSLKNLLKGRMMQHQSEAQKIPLCVIIGPEKRGTVVNFWGMGWVQRDPFSPGVMGRKIQDLLKSVEAIHSVLTEVIKGRAESSGWIFQVLGRHHRFLSRRATQSELSFGQNTVVVVFIMSWKRKSVEAGRAIGNVWLNQLYFLKWQPENCLQFFGDLITHEVQNPLSSQSKRECSKMELEQRSMSLPTASIIPLPTSECQRSW